MHSNYFLEPQMESVSVCKSCQQRVLGVTKSAEFKTAQRVASNGYKAQILWLVHL